MLLTYSTFQQLLIYGITNTVLLILGQRNYERTLGLMSCGPLHDFGAKLWTRNKSRDKSHMPWSALTKDLTCTATTLCAF